jgi:hypothetical protein
MLTLFTPLRIIINYNKSKKKNSLIVHKKRDMHITFFVDNNLFNFKIELCVKLL